jgi:hypothetical protein
LDLQACTGLRYPFLFSVSGDLRISFRAVHRLLETPLFYLNYINVTQIYFSLEETKELCLAASLLCAKKIGLGYLLLLSLLAILDSSHNQAMQPYLPLNIKAIWRYLEKEMAEGRGDVVHNFDYPIVVLTIDGQTKRLLSSHVRATNPFCFDLSTCSNK